MCPHSAGDNEDSVAKRGTADLTGLRCIRWCWVFENVRKKRTKRVALHKIRHMLHSNGQDHENVLTGYFAWHNTRRL